MAVSDITNLSQIFEDIGALKALVSSMDSKLDDGNAEFRTLRQDLATLQLQMSQLKSSSEERVSTVNRILESNAATEKRVDQLVALRHRLGGAMILVSLLSGVLYEAWGILAKVVMYASTAPK